MEVEICACSHKLDHLRKKCQHVDDGVACNCAYGTRLDLATFRLLSDFAGVLDQLNTNIVRLVAVMESASGLQSRVVANGNGTSRIEVRKKPPERGGIIVPG